jgi:hypothetical protein
MTNHTNLYERIQKLKKSGVILNVWGDGFDTPEHEGILGDIIEFLLETKANSIEAETFIQIYSWEYESIHEGITTYYSNFYENSPYKKILETADILKQWGHNELCEIYLKGAEDYKSGLLDKEYPPEWLVVHKEIDQWIQDNLEIIFHCMIDILDRMKEIKP